MPVSIGTYKAEVARRALDLGATIVNDITAFTADAGMASLVARTGAAAILKHNRGRSTAMYDRAVYTDVVGQGDSPLLRLTE